MNYKFVTKIAVSVTAALLLSTQAFADTVVVGAECNGTANTLFNKTLQGKAISQTFPESKAICTASDTLSTGAAQSFFVYVKDLAGKPVTCQIRQYGVDGSNLAILDTVSSSGSGVVERLDFVDVTPAAGTGSYIACTVPLIGQIISFGEVVAAP